MQRQPEEKKRYYPTPCLCLREAIVAAHAEAHVRMHVILDTSSSFCSYQHAHTHSHTHTHTLSLVGVLALTQDLKAEKELSKELMATETEVLSLAA